MAQVYKNKSFNSISACYWIHKYIHRRMGNSLRGRERERDSSCTYTVSVWVHTLSQRERARQFLPQRKRESAEIVIRSNCGIYYFYSPHFYSHFDQKELLSNEHRGSLHLQLLHYNIACQFTQNVPKTKIMVTHQWYLPRYSLYNIYLSNLWCHL